MKKSGIGVFGSVVGTTQDNKNEAVVTVESVPLNSDDSIYNLIFSKYDVEKNE